MQEELKERIKFVTVGNQTINSFRGGTMNMGFDNMDSTYVLPPQDLAHNVFKGLPLNMSIPNLSSCHFLENID